jgi:hypothetical protein
VLIATIAAYALGLSTVLRLPSDYLRDEAAKPSRHSPVPAALIRAVRNVGGVVLIAVGLVLAIPGVPGPGLLVALSGFLLLNLPGKRRLERKVLGRPFVLSRVNRVRTRFRKPPLLAPREGT